MLVGVYECVNGLAPSYLSLHLIERTSAYGLWRGGGQKACPSKTKDHYTCLKDPSPRLCYCFDLKFAIRLLIERDKTSTVHLVKI